ncbi:MAG TPA: lysophospholipid acyltransferase family protein [Xanthobacteraceae bacterium]|nr:lysophospholipid acyltransferase family protein [Xanthobacteraceae bacterium]
MLSSRRIARSPLVQKFIGRLAAEYLRLVWRTSRLTIEPADLYEAVEPYQPVIVAMWHGQHFMVPFLNRGHRVKVLISRHRDGEINAYAAQQLGVETVRGSGDHGRRFDLKGGVGAFKSMLMALEEGYNMALTADVPKVARVVGLGIIKLGQLSGRPIYPVAVATSRRIVLNNWDRSAINLPFGRVAIVSSHPVLVPADADDAMMEQCRAMLERGLSQVTDRAYEIVDRKDRHAASS